MFKSFFSSSFSFKNGLIIPFLKPISFNSTYIGNLIINYPSARKNQLESIISKYETVNLKHVQNLNDVTENEKEIITSNKWRLVSSNESKNSSLKQEFSFGSKEKALEFISIVKNRCDEIDHHPLWIIQKNSQNGYDLNVDLTSHFANNNVTKMDIYLAAYFSYNYDYIGIIKTRCERKMFAYVLSIIFVYFIYSFSSKKYRKFFKN